MNTLLRRAIYATGQREHGQQVVNIGPECFGLVDSSVLCWRGENYTPQRPSLRVRLHNWLIRIDGARRLA